jgi:aryl-alcohol dehydrogenase-like predicted oxidoreductase
MKPVAIPNTDLTVSNLCLGGGGLGTRTPVDDACRLIDRFLEMGGNFVDSAHIYAAWAPGEWGTSERTIGEWYRRSKNRDGLLVMTKGGHPELATMNISRLGRADIEKDLDESLDRLGIETIDVYLMHRDDPKRPAGEIVEVLADARKAGKIRWYGVSNWSVARIAEASAYAKAHGLPDIAVNQLGWSLAKPKADAPRDATTFFMDPPTEAYHTETQLFAAAYSPHAGGFFSKDLTEADITAARASFDYNQRAYYSPENYGRFVRARELAAKYGVTANAVALASLVHKRFPSCAIIGCGTIEHLEDSGQAGDVPLTAEEVRWLEDGE